MKHLKFNKYLKYEHVIWYTYKCCNYRIYDYIILKKPNETNLFSFLFLWLILYSFNLTFKSNLFNCVSNSTNTFETMILSLYLVSSFYYTLLYCFLKRQESSLNPFP